LAQESSVPILDVAASAALMDELTGITARAAETILDLAKTGDTRTKADGSPVTAADEAAEAVICEGLQRLAPDIPIIAEEQAGRARPKSIERGSYFLVDPLDGTQEFIAGSHEYTVNIAIVTDRLPILGVIAAPASGLAWRGIVGRGAEKLEFPGGKTSPIHTRRRPAHEPVIMISRSHLEARTRAYVDGHAPAKLVACGSSVKFCRLAEGLADLYPRLAPTHDWDIAAGHAILTAAGGRVSTPDGSPLVYGTSELLIPGFIASGDPAAPITA
jgi:3'(2'), 5'-bisphosphate nucleotidase